MGATASTFEENLKKRTDNIASYHNEVQASINRIQNKSNMLLKTIKERGYNDKNVICSRIIWQNYDELLSFFPLVNVNGVRYKAGVQPANLPDELQQSKIQTCLDISTLYIKKINLINYILEELPKCVSMENAVYNNLADKLRTENANTQKWLNIYQKLENFNKEIKKRYDLIYNQLENIRLAKTIAQMDGVANTTFAMMSNTNTTCKNYENDLIIYSSKASDVPQKPLPSPPGAGNPSGGDLNNLAQRLSQ